MVRVRIAPSPTGLAHIGLARTALFNYLFSKKNNGSFVLRIEDTDKERSKKEYESLIIEQLRWLGIAWNEGPDIGGEYGPYRQSERGHIYRDYLKKLADSQRLYKCYCTKDELEQEKQEQILAKLPPRYSGKCRKLNDNNRAQYEQEGRDFTLRFCLEPQTITITDLIRGKVTFDTALMDDFIIAKDFDTPLYNFAVVIDDALMKITHVIRGEEHISNTPKQIQLSMALGLTAPEFGHLPLILDSDRKKMSKRENKTALGEYIHDGYLPEALINFIALLGWNPGGDEEFFTLSQLESLFDINQVNKSGAIFDVQKLDWFNGHYIRQKDSKELALLLRPYLQGFGDLDSTTVDIERVAIVEKTRLKKLSDITQVASIYFKDELQYEPELLQWKETPSDQLIVNLSWCKDIIQSIGDSEWDVPHLEQRFKENISVESKKTGEVLWPLRVALSGQKNSPSPFEILWIIGKSSGCKRIDAAIQKLT